MLGHAKSATWNRKIYVFLTRIPAPYKTIQFVTGLRESLQSFQNQGCESGFEQTEGKKLRPEPAWKKSGLAQIGGDYMNSLRMMLVGAALITGGSALASAQVVQQNVAFRDGDHDRNRDRDRDRDHDRDRNRGYNNNYNNNYRVYRDRDGDRDDRRYVGRDYRYDGGYNQGYYGNNRRWDGHRWAYWNGRNWVY
jgi:hypothetical protein